MKREEVLNFITSRRSIRKFTAEPVSEEDLTVILKCAMAAPSARNARPWSFVVVQKRETLNKLSLAHSHAKMLSEATLAIAVLGDETISEYWPQDCSAVTQNILLAANALGLGSVWLGVHPRPERIKAVGETLGIPENIQILSLIGIGHPGEKKPPKTDYETEKIHKEKW
ncbi:MAG TPA: nitroreductase family protein [Candidatus Eremiobacteraeota bacterium]|nr:MAG: NADPH-flavin oxidoreductase [bacterium ADurb.Bin363]HPZ08441.1 nitroreductase family protein [Candidatus Eremiobacteraeota bacterium]